MKATIIHKKTIKVTVPTVKPVLSEVPQFLPQSLISTDDENTLTTGTDGLLYATSLADVGDFDPLAHYILAKS